MRKQALIQLHALDVAVRGPLEAPHDVPAAAFERYDACGVGPAAVYCRQGAHRAALQHAMAGVVHSIESRPLAAANGGQTPTVATSRQSD